MERICKKRKITESRVGCRDVVDRVVRGVLGVVRSVCYPGVCAIQECVLSRSICYSGVCAIQECVLPGRMTVLSRSMCYPGVCATRTYDCAIQEYVLSRSVCYPDV